MKKIISIDHGNRLIKTEHMVFPAAFVESGHLPAIGSDALKYQGKVYTLNDKNFPVQMDKTENENYFILTLFALGKELVDEAKIIRKLTPHDPIRVELLIGLPIQHYEASRKKYEQYFGNRQGIIPFELNGQAYSVRLTGAHAFPQAYAAAVTGFGQLRDTRILNIVDIGGFTVDCLQMDKFMPNLSLCTSFYSGVNNLFQLINEQSRSTGGRDISSSILEGIIGKDPGVLTDYSEQRIKTVTSAAIAHTENMLAEIAQKGFDLEEDKTIFMGGGSVLLKEYILKTGKVKKPVFIGDIHANAKGYRAMYDMERDKANKQASSA